MPVRSPQLYVDSIILHDARLRSSRIVSFLGVGALRPLRSGLAALIRLATMSEFQKDVGGMAVMLCVRGLAPGRASGQAFRYRCSCRCLRWRS